MKFFRRLRKLERRLVFQGTKKQETNATIGSLFSCFMDF